MVKNNFQTSNFYLKLKVVIELHYFGAKNALYEDFWEFGSLALDTVLYFDQELFTNRATLYLLQIFVYTNFFVVQICQNFLYKFVYNSCLNLHHFIIPIHMKTFLSNFYLIHFILQIVYKSCTNLYKCYSNLYTIPDKFISCKFLYKFLTTLYTNFMQIYTIF